MQHLAKWATVMFCYNSVAHDKICKFAIFWK